MLADLTLLGGFSNLLLPRSFLRPVKTECLGWGLGIGGLRISLDDFNIQLSLDSPIEATAVSVEYRHHCIKVAMWKPSIHWDA